MTPVTVTASFESSRFRYCTDHLRQTGARLKFLSIEPLLGPIADLDLSAIDWVKAGRGCRMVTVDKGEDSQVEPCESGAGLFLWPQFENKESVMRDYLRVVRFFVLSALLALNLLPHAMAQSTETFFPSSNPAITWLAPTPHGETIYKASFIILVKG